MLSLPKSFEPYQELGPWASWLTCTDDLLLPFITLYSKTFCYDILNKSCLALLHLSNQMKI